jgi:hypothetical protein
MNLSALTDESAQADTQKKDFSEQIERIIPRSGRIGLIKPYAYTIGLFQRMHKILLTGDLNKRHELRATGKLQTSQLYL